MGNTEAKMVEAIRDPSEEPRVREVFEAFDVDKSGALDEAEWRTFCHILWKADIEGATEDVKAEVGKEYRAVANRGVEPGIGTGTYRAMIRNFSSIAEQATEIIAKEVAPPFIDNWTKRMFKLADKDANGKISYEEFKNFIQKDNIEEIEKQKQKVRDAVAQNLVDNNGAIYAQERNPDGTVKTYLVHGQGLRPEHVRKNRDKRQFSSDDDVMKPAQ